MSPEADENVLLCAASAAAYLNTKWYVMECYNGGLLVHVDHFYAIKQDANMHGKPVAAETSAQHSCNQASLPCYGREDSALP